MAVNHALYTPFKASELDADELQTGLVEHVAYVVASASEAQSLDLTGIAVPALVLGVTLFAYDASDTVTAHDGTTCLVTSDGKRFKNDGTRVSGWTGYTVDDDDLTAPPGSETVGDKYLLPAAPTGDWSAYGKHVAIYTQRGYVYIAPREGMLVYVSDEDAYVRYNGTSWVAGFGAAGVADGSLKAAKLEQAYGWRVESETATPPGSLPAEGTLYIVGGSATGAWAGEDGNIARSTGSAWEFIDAAAGMAVFNKALGYIVVFKSGAWQVDRPSGAIIYRSAMTTGTETIDTTSYEEVLDFGEYTVNQANNRLSVRGTIDVNSNNALTSITVGLFFNAEGTPRDSRTLPVSGTAKGLFFELEYAVPDLNPRDVYIKLQLNTSNSNGITTRGVLEEVVP